MRGDNDVQPSPAGARPRPRRGQWRSSVQARRARQTLRVIVVTALSLSASLLVTPPAHASELDVDIPSGGSDISVAREHSRAQTFTARVTGSLDRLDVHIAPMPYTNRPLLVEVRSVAADGSPGTQTLASKEVPLSDVPAYSTREWLMVTFAAPAQVVAGTRYAAVLTSDTPYFGPNIDNPDLAYYAWLTTSGDVYAPGAAYYMDNRVASPAWTAWAADSSLRTYVTPSSTDVDNDGLDDSRDPDVVADAVTALPADAFAARGQQSAVLARLDEVETLLLAGKVDDARAEVAALRMRLDGCTATTTADRNDWITDCDSQTQIRTLLDNLAAAI